VTVKAGSTGFDVQRMTRGEVDLHCREAVPDCVDLLPLDRGVHGHKALQLQRPLPDDALRIVARGERRDEASDLAA
jgi:hypothetical protein